MLDQANVLILDEPTNHLDVHSKEILEEALFDFEGTLLFISHDRYFINRLAEKIIELTPLGLKIYPGDYDEYQIKKQTALPAANVVSEKVSSYEIDKKAKRDERAIKRRLEQLEAEIAAIEEEITELELSLLNPAEQQNYQFLQQVSDTLERRKSELTEKYDLWQQWME
jgi:ATP-binding cassette subfamily F protein 3